MPFPHVRLVTAFALLQPCLPAQTTECISRTPTGATANSGSVAPTVSGDGRFVAFQSYATNLVQGDTNATWDIFLRDRLTSTTVLVSTTGQPTPANGPSSSPHISADGRYVAFDSLATNLSPLDTDATFDAYVFDRILGTVELVSVDSLGNKLPTPSGQTSISGDGRFVGLLRSDSLNGETLIRDRTLNRTFSLCMANAMGSPAISIDGSWAAYIYTQASSTIIEVKDLVTGNTSTVAQIPVAGPTGAYFVGQPCISDAGRFIGFCTRFPLIAGDTTNHDVYVYDRLNGTTRLASHALGGVASSDQSFYPSMSASGEQVAFGSSSVDLIASDLTISGGDIYVYSWSTGNVELVSLSMGGVQAAPGAEGPAISADGNVVAFASSSSSLVGSDTNGATDVFVRLRTTPSASNYCIAKVNSQGCTPAIGWTGTPSVSGADDFHVTASQVRNASPGIMFWGTSPTAVPFAGGTRCVQAPLIRTDFLVSGGSPFPTADCTGTYDYSFTHAYMASFFLGAGTTVYAQFWQRDSIHPDGTGQGLTDGLRFTITP